MVPETHSTNYVGIDFGKTGGLFSNTSSTNVTGLSNNTYLNAAGSAWIYKETDEASYYNQTAGTHRFSVAPSGTAGNSITWSEAMRIDSSGNVGIGTDLPASGLELEGVGNATNVTLDNTTASTGRSYSIRSGNTGNLDFYDNDATNARVTIDASGNLLVGKTSTSGGIAGTVLAASGLTRLTASGIAVAEINRLGSNGSVVDLKKDGAPVASIGVVSDDRLYIATADGLGLQFDKDNNRIIPSDAAGGYNSNVSLGSSGLEFKDLYLSGHLQLSGSTDNIIRSGSDSSRVRIFGGDTESVADGAALTLQGVNHSSGNFVDLASASGGYINFRNGTSNAMRIDANGHLLLNTTVNAGNYTFRFNGVGAIGDTDSALKLGRLDANTVFLQGTSDASVTKAIAFMGTSEYGRFDSSGNLQVGFTSYSSLGSVNTGCRLSHDGQTNALARGSNGVSSFFLQR